MAKDNNFSLFSVKFRKDLGLETTYDKTEALGGDVSKKTLIENCNVPCHPDIREIAARLRVHFAVIHGLISPDLASKSFEEMTEDEQNEFQEVVESITITKARFIGTDRQDRKFILSASREVLPSRYVGFATPKINCDDEIYDMSAELTNLMEQLENEVYAYLFENKYQQTMLDFKPESVEDNNNSLEAK